MVRERPENQAGRRTSFSSRRNRPATHLVRLHPCRCGDADRDDRLDSDGPAPALSDRAVGGGQTGPTTQRFLACVVVPGRGPLPDVPHTLGCPGLMNHRLDAVDQPAAIRSSMCSTCSAVARPEPRQQRRRHQVRVLDRPGRLAVRQMRPRERQRHRRVRVGPELDLPQVSPFPPPPRLRRPAIDLEPGGLRLRLDILAEADPAPRTPPRTPRRRARPEPARRSPSAAGAAPRSLPSRHWTQRPRPPRSSPAPRNGSRSPDSAPRPRGSCPSSRSPSTPPTRRLRPPATPHSRSPPRAPTRPPAPSRTAPPPSGRPPPRSAPWGAPGGDSDVLFPTACPENAATSAPPPAARSRLADGGV